MAKSCWGLCVGVVAVVHSTVNVAAPELVCSPCCLGEPGLAAFSFCMVDDGNARDVYSRMLTSGFVWAWVADVWVCVSLGYSVHSVKWELCAQGYGMKWAKGLGEWFYWGSQMGKRWMLFGGFLLFFCCCCFDKMRSPWYNHTGWLGVKRQLTYS